MIKKLALMMAALFCFLELTPCTGYAEFKLPKALRTIEDEAFMGDAVTGVVKLPSWLKTVGDRVFAETDIYALDISDPYFDSIGSRLFGDREVAYVIAGSKNPDKVSEDSFYGARMIIGYWGWKQYAESRGMLYVYDDNLVEYDGFYYEIVDERAKLLCAVNASDIPETVMLPDSVNGYPLTSLTASAFFRCAQVTSITLPNSVETIADGAFDGAPKARIRYQDKFGITKQPEGVYTRENDWVTLTVQANAAIYRWQYYNGEWTDVNYEGCKTDTLRFQFTPALIEETASWNSRTPNLWRCIISDAFGNSQISNATYVLEKPSFTLEPEDQAGSLGETVRFSAEVSGGFESWRWERMDEESGAWSAFADAEGRSNDCDVFVNNKNRSSRFRAMATDYHGNCYPSRTVCIRGLDEVYIEKQPVDCYGSGGDEVSFSLTAKNATSYRWQLSVDEGETWTDMEGAAAGSDSISFTLEPPHYDTVYRCVVSNDTGSVTSNTVRALPPILDQLIDISSFTWNTDSSEIIANGIPAGETVTLSGYSALEGWSWSVRDTLIVDYDGVTVIESDGETSLVAQIVSADEQTDGSAHVRLTLKSSRMGRAVLEGTNGAETVSCPLEIYGPKPVIVTQPQDQVGEIGEEVQFTLDAIGAVSYNWNYYSFDFPDTDVEDPTLSVVIESGQYYENKSGSSWKCQVRGRDGVTLSNAVHVYRPTSCSIEEGDIIKENILENVTFHCHGYSFSSLYLECSYDDGDTWQIDSSSTGDYIRGSDTFTRTTVGGVNTLWRCRVIGFDGEEVCSDVVRILESQPVTILRQPTDQYARAGETARFEIEAENAASYWWQISYDGGENWAYISYNGVDQTEPVLKVDVSEWKYDQLLWRCKVTGVSGLVLTSQIASLKRPSFGFLMQPTDQFVSVGETATFSVQTSNAISCQWQQRSGNGEWQDIESGTGASVQIAVTESALRDMQYRCVITGADDNTIASTSVRMIEKLAITAQPQDATLGGGDSASFTVGTTGARRWQWYVSRDGGVSWEPSAFTGATTSALSFTVETAHFDWLWRCDVEGDEGQRACSRTVCINPLLRITEQPEHVEAEIGQTNWFKITAENASAYQWQVSADGGASWANASGISTNPSYSFTVTAQSDYEKQWRCVVSDSRKNKMYSNASRVLEPSSVPVIYTQPASLYADEGEVALFTVLATGVYQYQWQVSNDGGATWSNAVGEGANTAQMDVSITETLWNTVQWRCKLTGSGCALTYTNPVRVYEPLAIIDEPVDAEGRVGEIVSFAVRAKGATCYQWQESVDYGLNWSDCEDPYVSGSALDVPVEAASFDAYRWRCLVFGPLGDSVASAVVRLRQAVVPVTDLSLDMSETVLLPAETRQLKATIEPADATEQRIVWLSDDPGIAKVDDSGLVRPVSLGTTRIRASVGGFEAVCTVTTVDNLSVEFPEFVSSTWTNDIYYKGIDIKLNGAVMPCTVTANIIDKKGNIYRTSGSVKVSEQNWKWETGAFGKTGTYHVVVQATDAANRTVSVRTGDITVKRRPVYRALMIYQRDWLLNDKNKPYEAAWFKDDAQYMKKLLLENSYEGGAKYTVSMSANQSKNKIKSKIKSTFKGVQKGDVSFIQIGCHGNPSKGGSLFIPAATSYKNKQNASAGGDAYRISASELSKWIKQYIPKGKVIIVLHSCGSGAMVYKYIDAAKGGSSVDDAFISAFRDLDRAERSGDRTGELKVSRFVVLTSSANKENGYGWANSGCFLAYAISEANGFIRSYSEPLQLNHRIGLPSDSNGDGCVSAAECYAYVRKKCKEYSSWYKNVSAHPKAYWSNPDFVLFHYDD